jgi:hypothetical protein
MGTKEERFCQCQASEHSAISMPGLIGIKELLPKLCATSATPIRSFEGTLAVFDIDWTIVASAIGLLISFSALFYARKRRD